MNGGDILKKTMIILLIITIIASFTGCGNSINQSHKNSSSVNSNHSDQMTSTGIQKSENDPDYKGIALNINSTNLNEISKKIFDMYLLQFTQKDVVDYTRIKEYSIQIIRINKGDFNNFQFYVEFSIKPASDKFVLSAGGKLDSSGWITGKIYFVTVNKDKDLFKISSISTSP